MTDSIDIIDEMYKVESYRQSNRKINFNRDKNNNVITEPYYEPLLTDERDDSRSKESTEFNGWGGVAAPYTTAFDKDQLVHTVKGTARAVSGGIINAANGFIDMTGEMGEVLNNILPYNLGKLGYITFTPEDGLGYQMDKPTDIPEWQLPSPPRGDTMFEPFVRGMVQFIAGLALTRGAGTTTGAFVKRGAVSAMLFDPVDGGLVTMLREFGIGTEALEIFDTKVPEDAPAYQKLYGRLRNGLEELNLGILFEGAIQGIKNINRVPELRQKAIEAIKNMEVKVDPNTLGTMGGNITIGKKDGGGPPITPDRVVDDLGFYSQLREEVGNVKQEKFGSIEQFTNMLKGKVKQEELDWSGLGDAFQGKKFTKQEVIDYLDNNHVELEEIRKIDLVPEIRKIDFDSGWTQNDVGNEIWSHPDSSYTIEKNGRYRTTNALDGTFPLNPNAYTIYNEGGYSIDVGATSRAEAEIRVKSFMEQDMEDNFDFNNDEAGGVLRRPDDDMPALGDNNPPKDNIVEGGPTVYERYTEKGGTNYREFLIRNKNYEGDPSYVKLKLTPDELEELKALDNKNKSSKFGIVGEEYKRYNKLLEKQGIANSEAKLSEFRASSHWRGENEKNIIFHVRMTDRTGPNGEKVLYVDELQSDWSQQGSGRAGNSSFKTETGSAEKIKIEKEIGVLEKEINALLKPYRVAFIDRDLMYHKYRGQEINPVGTVNLKDLKTTDSKNLQIVPDDIVKKAENIRLQIKALKDEKLKIGPENVPRGPYVQDTDKWTALAIKRLLRVAVEEGYDSIAFSPGEVHKQRWNEPGLIEFYDSKIPSVTKNVINKNLKIKDYKYTTSTLKDVEDVKIDTKLVDDIGQERFIITITPEIQDKVMKGISLFSAGAIATKAGSEMLEEREPANGY